MSRRQNNDMHLQTHSHLHFFVIYLLIWTALSQLRMLKWYLWWWPRNIFWSPMASWNPLCSTWWSTSIIFKKNNKKKDDHHYYDLLAYLSMYVWTLWRSHNLHLPSSKKKKKTSAVIPICMQPLLVGGRHAGVFLLLVSSMCVSITGPEWEAN